MKKIFSIIFLSLCLSSCFTKENENISQENYLKEEVFDSSIEKNLDNSYLIALYENIPDNKEIKEKELEWKEKYFLEWLDICKNMISYDFTNKVDIEKFLEEVDLFSIYNLFIINKIESYEKCLENSEIIKECKINWINKSDLLITSYFAWKTKKDFFQKEIDILIGEYSQTEPSNSILLNFIKEKINWKKIIFDDCKKDFLEKYE